MKPEEIRKLSGLSKKDFAEAYGIPYRTWQNWELGTNKCPKYMLDLLERAVKEDSEALTLKCYDDNILRELGAVYNGLLHVMNITGRNPYPNAEIFPWKYFVMIHSKAVGLHIPAHLSERIALLMNAIDTDDFDNAMTTPCPMEKRQYFLFGMMGYGND